MDLPLLKKRFYPKRRSSYRRGNPGLLFFGRYKPRQRELQALTEVKDALKPNRLTVITDDEELTVLTEHEYDQNKINIIPLWKWLIQK